MLTPSAGRGTAVETPTETPPLSPLHAHGFLSFCSNVVLTLGR